MRHTPGPWRTFVWNEFAGEAVIPHVTVITDNKGIAKFSRWTDEVMANALLIAAAPELLEALEGYVERDEKMATHGTVPYSAQTINNWRLLARAAIKKARGEK